MTSDDALQLARQLVPLPEAAAPEVLWRAALEAVRGERRHMPRDWPIGRAAEDLLLALLGDPAPFIFRRVS